MSLYGNAEIRMSTNAAPTSPAIKRHSATWRWMRASSLVIVVLAAVFFAARALTHRVRDLNASEMRARMDNGGLEVDTAIQQLNRMDVESRRDVMQSAEAQNYFTKLKPEQRARFVKETLDRGIQQQIERYRKMSPEERSKFITDVQDRQREQRERIQNLPPEERQRVKEMANSGNMREVVEKAVKMYLSVTSSAERAELAPLFDAALDNLDFAKGL
jgi:hypothetical protein